MAPAFGRVRRLFGRGQVSRDVLEHTDFEAAVDVCSEDELDRSGRLVVRLARRRERQRADYHVHRARPPLRSRQRALRDRSGSAGRNAGDDAYLA
jgi:hypothetical protein